MSNTDQMQQEIDALRTTLKKYVQRENRIKHISGLPLVFAMLCEKGDSTSGEAAFNAMDQDSKSIFIQMSKKATDHLISVYYNDDGDGKQYEMDGKIND